MKVAHTPDPSVNGASQGLVPTASDASQAPDTHVLSDSSTALAGPAASTGHEPPHLSWSQMQAWLHCPKAYEYRYALGIAAEFTPQALALGTAVHAGLAHHYRTLLETGVASVPEDLSAVAGASLTAHEPAVRLDEGTSLEDLSNQAATLVAAVVVSPVGTPAGTIIGVEEPLEGSLGPDLPPFHAYVDLITLEERESGQVLTVRDFKTTRSAWGQAQVREHAGQLALYKALLPVEAGATVALEFITIGKGKQARVETLPVDDRDAGVQTVLAQARSILAGVRAGCFPARPGWGCASCPYRARCPHAAV